jgi:uncharacterized protein YgiM (DUF1202 family)
LQVRIRHQQNGKVFHTIYAHLSETLVRKGQRVSAGQKIALADNTGNSFGSHLHLTLKIEGETTRGYPTGIVDPWPYLSEEVATEPAPEPDLPASSGVSGYTTADLNLRAASSASAEILALIPAGERLDLLGDPAEARARIGQENVWLPVRTAGGKGGYVAAWYVQNAETAFPPTGLVVYPNDAVNLRSGPATTFALLASLTAADALTVLGDEAIARGRIGKANEWLQVQAPNGQRGFVAAWLVHRTGQNPPASSLTVYPTGLVNLRARPDTEANVLAVVSPADALTVLGDAASAAARIGREGEWLQVRAPNGLTGSIAAWLVALQPVTGGTATALTLYPTTELNLRAQPSINSPRLGKLTRNAPFQVMETDLAAARVKVGQNEQWIYGQAAGGERGWAAAWYLGVSPV